MSKNICIFPPDWDQAFDKKFRGPWKSRAALDLPNFKQKIKFWRGSKGDQKARCMPIQGSPPSNSGLRKCLEFQIVCITRVLFLILGKVGML